MNKYTSVRKQVGILQEHENTNNKTNMNSIWLLFKLGKKIKQQPKIYGRAHPFTMHFRIFGFLWSFAVYLEAISVLPQLRYMQNAKMIEPMTGKYVFALGLSKFLGLANWIIQIYETRGHYFFWDEGGYFWYVTGFIAEMVQSFILADFCYYYIKSFMQGQLLKKMPV
ncbi:hypothetical protein TanjilG_14219 [Lupinus angustifolius]|uniref:ER lumen protein-retaining receptor n=1 Tax=Lupinus angustifolius TaxID=3871 RepID=A0A1J7GKT7_LUPAN|nr:hypothetical protein TanjilG_14219 [Lupinus angustifolius]